MSAEIGGVPLADLVDDFTSSSGASDADVVAWRHVVSLTSPGLEIADGAGE